MATAAQYNNLMGAYNKAISSQQYGGGPAGSDLLWNNYNTLLDKYGIGNGSVSGVGTGTGAYTGGIGGTYGTGTAGGGATGSAFSLNPSPQAGAGTFGAVPGAIGAPPSRWDQVNSNVPGMSGLTNQNASLIQSQLNGTLSPGTTGSLIDTAAARGVSLGQGGSTGLTNEILLRTLGLTKEQLQQQGSSNYLNFLNTTSQLQQDPNLLAEIASRNATMAAAPNPTLASQYLMGLSRGSSTGLHSPLSYLGGFGISPTATYGGGYQDMGLGTGGYGNMGYSLPPQLTMSGAYNNYGNGFSNTGAYPSSFQQNDNIGAFNRVDDYLYGDPEDYSQNGDLPQNQDQGYEDIWE